jgi:hypothetical protein
MLDAAAFRASAHLILFARRYQGNLPEAMKFLAYRSGGYIQTIFV